MDPFVSPARYATDPFVDYYYVATTTETETSGWIKGFSRVKHLWLVDGHGYSVYGLIHPTPRIVTLQGFDLILSFTLLEDTILTVFLGAFTDNGKGPDRPSTIDQYQNPPTLTGPMELFLRDGV